ncbi:MAG: tRNA preQ1(34) S-adenosylmethionine ribosyltransferase-isomerase QueA [Clostridia bacterium]|nr:tRNA preQ1(34) S-adenosylmethionine ribosyltransferase-isomerase QueA [Clostridia bacterium]
MKTSDFYYNLPQELIAQTPLKERSKSRMMVLDKVTGEVMHKSFENILEYLNEGDTIVLNNTRVIPARLYGSRQDKEEKIEILLTKQLENDMWEVLVKPGKKAKIGTTILFGGGLLKAEVIDILEEGERIVKFTYEGIFNEILDKLGTMPLPPYITEKLEEKERYQTVYSKINGSAAAPTAGLHFTQEILKKIEEKKVNIVYVTLHVGIGTFRPVKVDTIENHKMHTEHFIISKKAAETINETKKRGNKVLCVGTTSCRVVESASDENGTLHEMEGDTSIFIYPGYKFKVVDNLLTNFHLPESTLLMLVSALSSREIILNAYNEAVKERYRFFSFGDCMYIK